MNNYRLVEEANCFKIPSDWVTYGNENHDTCFVCGRLMQTPTKTQTRYDVHDAQGVLAPVIIYDANGNVTFSNWDYEYQQYFGQGKGLLNKEGKVVAHEEGAEMGYWPVGAQCRKKVPADFLNVYYPINDLPDTSSVPQDRKKLITAEAITYHIAQFIYSDDQMINGSVSLKNQPLEFLLMTIEADLIEAQLNK